MTLHFAGRQLTLALTMLLGVHLSSAQAQPPENASSLDEALQYRWQFTEDHWDEGQLRPLAGPVALESVSALGFDALAPGAAVFEAQAEGSQFYETSVPIEDLDLPRQSFTVEAWARVDEPLEWGGLFGAIQDNGSFERGWLLGFRKSRFSFAVASTETKRITYLTDENSFESGHWYHVVGTYDGVYQRLFVDGTLVATSTQQKGGVLYPEQAHVGVGAYWDRDEKYPLTGQVEQVSLWKRALSEEEIRLRFEARKSRFPGIESEAIQVVDWPTHMRDNRRTGIANNATLPNDLTLRWKHSARRGPEPAWPPPAQQDFWHHKESLKPRVIFDRALPVIAVGGSVYYASSSEDCVTCLDQATGNVRWRAYAEAPVRLAPTFAEGRILFGSDDGYAYCVDATNGNLLWKQRAAPENRQIVGNGRMVSIWPVRSSVLVEQGSAFFCGGLFPEQGVFAVAVDLQTGEVRARNSINASAQGYLERRGSGLHVATGRDRSGAFVSSLERQGKDAPHKGFDATQVAERFPFSLVGDSKSRFCGGVNELAAFDAESGALQWEAQVEGDVYNLAIAQDCLFVSTSQGYIYCFGSSPASEDVERAHYQPATSTSEIVVESPTPFKIDQAAHEQAQHVLKELPTNRGWALVLDSVELAANLARQSQLKIICVVADDNLATSARGKLRSWELDHRITVHHLDSKQDLPYSDYLFNVVVDAGGLDHRISGNRFKPAEIRRVTRPEGGVAILGWDRDSTFRRGPLKGVGEWSHQYANPGNTACSGDEQVGGAMRLQWFGEPGPQLMMDRHHRTAAPLWTRGRLFVPGNNHIFAVDAYNGTPLWEMSIPNSRRAGVYRDCSYLAATDSALFVSAADRCRMHAAGTGEVLREFKVPKSAPDSQHEWGYTAAINTTLYGSRQASGASRRDHSLIQINEGTYYDARPLVCSDALFAFNTQTGEQRWQYDCDDDLLVNSTIAIAGNHIYFIESNGLAAKHSQSKGRMTAASLFEAPANLVALDSKTGQEQWRQPIDLSKTEHAIYLCATETRLVVSGSYNAEEGGRSRVHVDIKNFDANSGKLIWERTQNNGTGINGSHGEQDLHPVIVEDRVYCEPFAYQLSTGLPLENWKWNASSRRGCGTIAASASTFFFRHSHPTMFDLNENKYSKVTTSSRPGCWINMIPAGGLLLIPEASSGCSCEYPVQASLAFLPIASE